MRNVPCFAGLSDAADAARVGGGEAAGGGRRAEGRLPGAEGEAKCKEGRRQSDHDVSYLILF